MFLCVYVPVCLCSTASIFNCIYVSSVFNMFLCVSVPVCLYSTVTIFQCVYVPVSMFLCVYVPVCLCSDVSKFHCVSVPVSMFQFVYIPLCLCSTVSMFLCVYVPLCLCPTGYVPSCLCSTLYIPLYLCSAVSSHHVCLCHTVPVFHRLCRPPLPCVRSVPACYTGYNNSPHCLQPCVCPCISPRDYIPSPCSTVSMFLFVSVPVCLYSSVTIFHCVYIPLCPCTSEACVCSAMSMLLCVFVPLCLCSSVSMFHWLCSIMSLFHPLHSTVCMFCRLFSSRVLVSYRAYVPPSLSPPSSALFVNVCDLSPPCYTPYNNGPHCLCSAVRVSIYLSWHPSTNQPIASLFSLVSLAASLAQWLRAFASRAADLGSIPGFGFFFFFFFFLTSSHTSDFKMGTPVVNQPGARRHWVSAGTGWSRVNIL